MKQDKNYVKIEASFFYGCNRSRQIKWLASDYAVWLLPILGAALYTGFPLSVVMLTDLVGAIIAGILLALVTIPKLTTIKKKKAK